MDLQCPICNQIFNQPVQTECGCRHCKICMEIHCRKSENERKICLCSNCNSEHGEIHYDRAFERDIDHRVTPQKLQPYQCKSSIEREVQPILEGIASFTELLNQELNGLVRTDQGDLRRSLDALDRQLEEINSCLVRVTRNGESVLYKVKTATTNLVERCKNFNDIVRRLSLLRRALDNIVRYKTFTEQQSNGVRRLSVRLPVDVLLRNDRIRRGWKEAADIIRDLRNTDVLISPIAMIYKAIIKADKLNFSVNEDIHAQEFYASWIVIRYDFRKSEKVSFESIEFEIYEKKFRIDLTFGDNTLKIIVIPLCRTPYPRITMCLGLIGSVREAPNEFSISYRNLQSSVTNNLFQVVIHFKRQ